MLFWPAALLLPLAAWKGRVFCAWGCPVGALLDLESWILRRLGYRGYRRTASLPRLGPWLALGVLLAALLGAGAVVGFLDPLVFAHRGLTFLRAGLLPEMLLLVLVLSFLAPRFWCRHLCPLGGLLSCADLRRFRAQQAKSAGTETQGLVGPDPKYSRRDFLLLAAGAVLAGGSAKAAGSLLPGAGKPFLRPPGALSEPGLTATCVRCGECVKVCPTRGLVPAFTEAGWAGLWTPHLVPRLGECKRCMLCGKVCPTSALRPIPLAVMKLGTAKIDQEKCWAWNRTRPCRICVERCPKRIIVLDEQKRPRLDAKACDGCGTCEKYCPVRQSAIVVWPDGERRRDQGGTDAAEATVREEL